MPFFLISLVNYRKRLFAEHHYTVLRGTVHVQFITGLFLEHQVIVSKSIHSNSRFGKFFGATNEHHRYPWVDYAKGIAIVLVVYRHMLDGYIGVGLDVPVYLTMIQVSVYNFRMPLFFILSGVFVRKSMAKRTFKAFTVYKLNTILYPYLVWVTIQLTLQVGMSGYTGGNRDVSYYQYILYDPWQLYQFWFLYTIFNITILFALLQTYVRIKPVGQVATGIFFYYLSGLEALQGINLLQDTLEYYIYFALGSACTNVLLDAKNRAFFSSYNLLWAYLPIFLVSQWYWIQHKDTGLEGTPQFALIAVIGCAFVFIVSFVLSKAQAASFLRVVGRHSMYIYIMHVMSIVMVRVVLMNFLGITHLAVLLLISLLVGVLFPIVAYRLSLRLGLWFLYNFRKPRLAV